MIIGRGFQERTLSEAETGEIVRQALADLPVDGRRVLVLIPDGTRTMPVPLMFCLLEDALGGRVKALDYLVALGTHQPMSDAQLTHLIGRPVIDGKAGAHRIYNHEWSDPASFTTVGVIPAAEISQITEGMLAVDVPVSLNRLIEDYDQLIICGPVFPHEVVGFSGGNKYLFPGIAGPEIINFTHWLGALITSYKIIGAGYTPVRAVIDRAAAFIQKPIACFSLVVTHAGLHGIFFGSAQESWRAAAALSAQVHILYLDKPVQRAISIMPRRYDDLWTAAKGMYKLEPVIADGGEVIIYAPHVSEVSYTHGKILDEIGYHCRDYFAKQWDQYQHYPWGVLAHSTHLRGMGSYDPASGVEKLRIQVTLATGIPEERCRRIGLGYLDPDSPELARLIGAEDENTLVVREAGEMLYRLREQPAVE
jgi:nickel-dependent lactate racemase